MSDLFIAVQSSVPLATEQFVQDFVQTFIDAAHFASEAFVQGQITDGHFATETYVQEQLSAGNFATEAFATGVAQDSASEAVAIHAAAVTAVHGAPSSAKLAVLHGGGRNIYVQETAPTAEFNGDLWIDTSGH